MPAFVAVVATPTEDGGEQPMKRAAETKKQPSKDRAKASRDATSVRRTGKETRPAEPAAAPPAARADGNGSAPMPDLTAFGVDPRDAHAHVGQCEQCGRAYRHVMKNPKDAMALQSFGRNISVCLADKQANPPA
jgi:hypothetical protein